MKSKTVMPIKIKYLSKEIEKIKKIPEGDWIDLRSAETIEIKLGEHHLIPLGIAVQLPHGYEAHIAARSSTYKKYGIIQVNAVGIVDNMYGGNNDQWFFSCIAMRDTKINLNDRICQFRIVENQPELDIIEVDDLENIDRGGFGSTGAK